MDSAGPSSSAAAAAAGSPPAPPPLLRLPRFTLGFGNPSPCTAANTSVDDLVAQLLRVAYEGDRTKVKRAAERLKRRTGMSIQKAVAQVQAPWSKRHGPLYMAAAAGEARLCNLLIKDKDFKLDVNATGTDGATPLFFAIYGNGSTYLGSTDVVRFLLENGADPNLAHISGVTPLHVATIRGNYDVAELLLSKNVDVESAWEFKTPLHIAAQHGNARMMTLLLQNEAKPNTYLIHTPLKAAVLRRSKIAVELLIKAGAHLNAGMPDNPLRAAAAAGLTDIIKCLLEAGANANITDGNGRTPIEIAAIQGWRECVAILFPATNPLAGVADWSIDGVIQHAKLASSLPQELVHEDGVSDFKSEGDAAFSNRDYSHALTLYTMAMEIDPYDSTLYSRRSLCFWRTCEGLGG